MHIEGTQVVRRLEELYALGLQADGTHSRLAFSPEDAKGRALFAGYFRELGIPTRTDEAGNLIARLDGSEGDLPAILLGSHLDTVPDGGKYDGALGCMAGYAVCAALVQNGTRLRHPLEVIVFADEEGARFGTGMFGSNAFCGSLGEPDAGAPDIFGTPRGEVLEKAGIVLSEAHRAKRDKSGVHCFLELHVEQGISLHQKGIPLGVVSSIAGVRRYEVSVTGQANHSGSTQMRHRKDALVAASAFISAIPGITAALGDEYTVATVGTIKVRPGAVNVIPGECVFSLEMRDQSEAVMQALELKFREKLESVCREQGCACAVTELSRHAPAPMSAWVREVIEKVCQNGNAPYAVVPSGAFHDAMILSESFPTGMIFVPSRDGISHSPLEYSTVEDIEAGCNILLRTVLELDKQDCPHN